MPKRIQRKRTKGWRAPEGAVYVGRGSKWGNPYRVTLSKDGLGVQMAKAWVPEDGETHSFFYDPILGGDLARTQAAKFAVELFRTRWMPLHTYAIRELRGKDLMCWCPLDAPCHADVLLGLANAP